MANKWLPIKDASIQLGVSDRTLRRWADTKRIKSRRINRVTHVLIDDRLLEKKDELNQDDTIGKQESNAKQKETNANTDTDREKDLKIAQLIKDLDETRGLVDWLKRGYEQLQATHYETATALNKIQLQLSPPRGQETANGEVVGFEGKTLSKGIVDAKKGKFLNDLTNILLVILLMVLIVGAVYYFVRGF